jgi:hypothetical protein
MRRVSLRRDIVVLACSVVAAILPVVLRVVLPLSDGVAAVVLQCGLEDGAQVLVELSEVLVDLQCDLFIGGGGS